MSGLGPSRILIARSSATMVAAATRNFSPHHGVSGGRRTGGWAKGPGPCSRWPPSLFFSAAAKSSSRLPSSSSPFEDDDEEEEPHKTVLVLGSSGALGSVVARHLSSNLGMQVIGADLMELPQDFTAGGPSWELDAFISLQGVQDDLRALTIKLVRGVHYVLEKKRQRLQRQEAGNNHGRFRHELPQVGLDALICASGGWQGDPNMPTPSTSSSSSLSEEGEVSAMESERSVEMGAMAYCQSIETMLSKNLYPVLASSFLAQHYMKDEAMMVVMGATAALSPTPGMMGYGVAKAAAHHVVQTLGATTGPSLTSPAQRRTARAARRHAPALDHLTVTAILPTMLDTPANRRANPQGPYSQWTPPLDIAQQIGQWIETPALRPHSGSLIRVQPRHDAAATGSSSFELVR